jgi:DNA modification methylase
VENRRLLGDKTAGRTVLYNDEEASWQRAVENSSRRGDAVLDPFAGSGTTLIACERSGRKARLIELDPRYVDVICERRRRFSGEQAIRYGDGCAFPEPTKEQRSNKPNTAQKSKRQKNEKHP